MAFTPGDRVGPYEIVELVGVGGMGEVYRARDRRLQRDVAIKVVAEARQVDPELLQRFEREARLLASLNHPNIATLHGIEASGDAPTLVMEYVDGETLDEWLTRVDGRGLPLKQALSVAQQLTEALDAAHERGIVHRDLKPANVKVRSDGTVKVLDFGIAKVFQAEDEGRRGTNMAVTQLPGAIIGTPAYMSPEQASGGTVDRRTDIWAFGCVLYEMLTGCRAFPGETATDVIGGVLGREPDFTLLPADTSAEVRRLLHRCLEKDVRARLRDIGDARYDLRAAPAASPSLPRSAPAWRRRVLAAGLVLLALGLTGATTAWMLRTAPPTRIVWLIASPPARESLPLTNRLDPDVAISRDGRHLVYVTGVPGAQQLHVRALEQLEARQLEGLGRAPRGPFMSPDGSRVGFFESGALKTVALSGGAAVTVCEVDGDPRGASWGEDDMIVFATNNPATGLFRVAGSGGEPELLTPSDSMRDADPQWPDVLPGGAVLFTSMPPGGAIEAAQLAVLDVRTGETKSLVRAAASQPRYVETGHIVYGMAGKLWAVAFDVDRLQVRSDPVQVLDRVVTKGSGAASFGVSSDGSLAYLSGDSLGGETTLVLVDRQGREQPVEAPRRRYRDLQLSPDGARVALSIPDQERDIWIWDFGRATLTRLTVGAGVESTPLWTPDGRRIAFAAGRGGATNVFWQLADGSGPEERLTQSANQQAPLSFSPDGTRLAFLDVGPSTGNDILELAVPPAGAAATELGEVRPLLRTPFFERGAAISPDGRWLAYASNESGEFEVYVRPFPDVEQEGRQQVSIRGGEGPRWSPDGRELFYLSAQRQLMSVPTESAVSFGFGAAQALFDWHGAAFPGSTYDVSPDGQRFLMIKPVAASDDPSAQAEIVVVLNWLGELQRLVPSER